MGYVVWKLSGIYVKNGKRKSMGGILEYIAWGGVMMTRAGRIRCCGFVCSKENKPRKDLRWILSLAQQLCGAIWIRGHDGKLERRLERFSKKTSRIKSMKVSERRPL